MEGGALRRLIRIKVALPCLRTRDFSVDSLPSRRPRSCCPSMTRPDGCSCFWMPFVSTEWTLMERVRSEGKRGPPVCMSVGLWSCAHVLGHAVPPRGRAREHDVTQEDAGRNPRVRRQGIATLTGIFGTHPRFALRRPPRERYACPDARVPARPACAAAGALRRSARLRASCLRVASAA